VGRVIPGDIGDVYTVAAAAAAAVCNTRVTGEFPVRTESHCMALTQRRRAAGQLNRGGEVVVVLLWGFLLPLLDSVWSHTTFVADCIHRIHRRVDDVVSDKSTAVAAMRSQASKTWSRSCCVRRRPTASPGKQSAAYTASP